MGISIIFDGTDLDTVGLVVTKSVHIKMASARTKVYDRAVRNGSVVQTRSFSSSQSRFKCYIEGTSRGDCIGKLDSLKVLLNPKLGPKFMQVEGEDDISGYERGAYAILMDEIKGNWLNRTVFEFELNFLYKDGLKKETSDTVQNVTIDANPKAFNVPAAGALGGTSEGYPIYVITNTDATTISTFTLTNSTRSESITCTIPLAQNDQLRIDTQRMHIEKSTDGGSTWTNAMSSVTGAETYPLLTPLVQNAFSISGFVAGTISITYRMEFL